jgi:hypothetical protein
MTTHAPLKLRPNQGVNYHIKMSMQFVMSFSQHQATEKRQAPQKFRVLLDIHTLLLLHVYSSICQPCEVIVHVVAFISTITHYIACMYYY